MALNLETWLVRYAAVKAALESGEKGDVWPDIERLERDAKELSLIGLDVAEAARCLAAIARAGVHLLQREPGACIERLRDSEPRIPVQDPEASLIVGNRCMTWGNLAVYQRDFDSALQYYREAAAVAASARSPELLGHALFNAGVCLSCFGQPADAKKSFNDARTAYVAAGQLDKVAESDHAIGNAAYAEGRLDEALFYLRRAGDFFMPTKDYLRLCLLTDDVSRVLVQKACTSNDQQKRDSWFEQAFNFAFKAAYFADRAWEGYFDNPKLHADLAERLVNQSITFCELALETGETLLFLGELARCKGRLRNFRLSSPRAADAAEENESTAVEQRMGPALVESVARSVIPLASPAAPVCICDQAAMHNGLVVSGTLTLDGNQRVIGWHAPDLPAAREQQQRPPSLRGEGRAHDLVAMANEYLKLVGEHSTRCCYVCGDLAGLPAVGDRDQLRDWTNVRARPGPLAESSCAVSDQRRRDQRRKQSASEGYPSCRRPELWGRTAGRVTRPRASA